MKVYFSKPLKTLVCTAAVITLIFGCRQYSHSNKKSTVREIGYRAIHQLLGRELRISGSKHHKSVHYAEACTGFGAVKLAALCDDTATVILLKDRYLQVITGNIENTANHVDANVYGILPLEIYLQTNDNRFLKQGLYLADAQWDTLTPEGLTWQTRYWIDDIWMIGSLQVQAYRVTGNEIYLRRAARELSSYINKLQQPNGLFFHGENSPFYWGRGNGWVAAGLAELLTELPATNEYYQNILQGYVRMMHALLNHQSKSGMWRQLIDVETSWKETSSTAMFGYAMCIGYKKGFLKGNKFKRAYHRTWNALTTYVNDKGEVTEVCQGTSKGNSLAYYLDRPRLDGDMHGQAPLLWFAWAMLL